MSDKEWEAFIWGIVRAFLLQYYESTGGTIEDYDAMSNKSQDSLHKRVGELVMLEYLGREQKW